MTVTTLKEIKRLRKSGRAIREALDAMTKAALPGVSTLELDRIGASILAEHGSKSAPKRVYQFPGNICISVNDEALHGIPSKRILQSGDLVKLDLVAELHGTYTDAAVTIIVGEGTQTDRNLIACAQKAFYEALAIIKPGIKSREIGKVIEQVAREYGFTCLEGFGGHGVGRTIHEPPFICGYDMEIDDVIEEGMVIALEPIICERGSANYKAEDGWTIVTKDGGRVAHFENTVAVMQGGNVIVTK